MLYAAVAVGWACLLPFGASSPALTTEVVLQVGVVLACAWFVVSTLVWPPAVRLDAQGLHVRRNYRWRTVRRDQVLDVRPPSWGRFPLAVLTAGRPVRLVGMPVEAGERLRVALELRSAT